MEEESSEVGLHGKSYHFYLERQGMVCSVHTLELDNKEMGDGDSNEELQRTREGSGC